jgi:four helix bundle protein
MQGHKDLKVFQMAYRLAMEIFQLSKSFPPEERYSLTDQVRRSSRSVAVNIAEGYRKRQYPKSFAAKLSDSDGEATETQVWLEFARDCEYISKEICQRLTDEYKEVGRMLGSMILHPEKFAPR